MGFSVWQGLLLLTSTASHYQIHVLFWPDLMNGTHDHTTTCLFTMVSRFSHLYLFFFFFGGGGEWRLNSHILILLFRQESVHSGSVSWDDCGRVFPGELHMSSFPDRFPHYAWKMAQSAQSDFPGSRVYECLGVTCHQHFWQNDWDLLCANTIPWGVS